MSYLSWEDKYSIGIQEMDDQHRRIVELINTLYDGRIEGNADTATLEALDGVTKYARKHFKDEEDLMEKVNFPQLEEHRAEHHQLVKSIIEFHKRVKGNSPPTNFELFSFLRKWLVEHIVESDKVYGKYIANKLSVETVDK